jgi:hypothetical protein
MSVTQAFSEPVAGAALGLAQFGWQLAFRWAAERAVEWIAALLGCFLSFFFVLLFPTLYTETRASLVPI